MNNELNTKVIEAYIVNSEGAYLMSTLIPVAEATSDLITTPPPYVPGIGTHEAVWVPIPGT